MWLSCARVLGKCRSTTAVPLVFGVACGPGVRSRTGVPVLCRTGRAVRRGTGRLARARMRRASVGRRSNSARSMSPRIITRKVPATARRSPPSGGGVPHDPSRRWRRPRNGGRRRTDSSQIACFRRSRARHQAVPSFMVISTTVTRSAFKAASTASATSRASVTRMAAAP